MQSFILHMFEALCLQVPGAAAAAAVCIQGSLGGCRLQQSWVLEDCRNNLKTLELQSTAHSSLPCLSSCLMHLE